MFRLEALTRTYHTGRVDVQALRDVSLAVPDGMILAIMGRSGSGKSTLLRQIGLLDMPTSGRIILDGNDVTALGERERSRLRLKHLGYVFQEYALLGELTALQNVYLPGMMLDAGGNSYRDRAAELLQTVGLGDRRHHYPRELSGGEQQRVAIARALINRPRALLADEPCANLDTVSSRMVMETLVRLNTDMNVTIVFVSHDPADRRYAHETITLGDGRVIEGEASPARDGEAR